MLLGSMADAAMREGEHGARSLHSSMVVVQRGWHFLPNAMRL
jgi:hypothetical protein